MRRYGDKKRGIEGGKESGRRRKEDRERMREGERAYTLQDIFVADQFATTDAKFWRSENMAKLNKNRHISDVTENKGIFHHFVFFIFL